MAENRLALATIPSTAPVVTDEHLQLVKTTVAAGATPPELQLFLYDCARQGVHPLDKLIHFTKRAGKYTPITSIDFLRIRAAESGECVGIDDAVFSGSLTIKEPNFTATVTVYRLVQGQRAPFSATARWSEYKPADQDFMWKKMPHVMLGKCAEALALRKAFPKQLHGLYVKEEMDQSGNDHTPLAKSLTASPGPAGGAPDGGAEVGAAVVPANLNAPLVGDGIPAAWRPFIADTMTITGVIENVSPGKTSGATYIKLDTGDIAGTMDHDKAAQASAFHASGECVVLVTQPHKKLTREIVSITAEADVLL